MARQALSIAPRYTKPANFAGSDIAWRSLCEVYPSAETPEILMAVMEYCAVRRLDPFKRPVHVIPMFNSRLGRRVQVVMSGINEIEITATRTGQWGGMDEPIFGPDETRKFSGEFDDERTGERKTTTIELTFPISCAVPVYRLIGGTPRRFVEPVYWIEAYGRAGFRSELPNHRWQTAPRQMVQKCAKSASLRAAFPEEGLGYAAEEMEDHETESGGITLDGQADYGTGGDQRAPQQPRPPPQEPRAEGLALLGVDDPQEWTTGLQALLSAAMTFEEIEHIEDHESVRRAKVDAPTLIRRTIDDAITEARIRVQRLHPETPQC